MLYPNLLPARRRLNRLSFLMLLLASTFVLGSCKRILGVNPYTIKGRLLEDCTGKPVANQMVYVKRAPDVFPTGDRNLGSGPTDAQGYFEFTCRSSTGNVRLYTDHGLTTNKYLEGFNLFMHAKGVEVLDVGNLYKWGQYHANVKMQINRTILPTDTLYVNGWMRLDGLNSSGLIAIHPVPASVTVNLKWIYGYTDTLQSPERNMEVYWGIGRQEFNSRQHKAPAKAYICQNSDTSVVVID